MNRMFRPVSDLTPAQREMLERVMLLLDSNPFVTGADLAVSMGRPRQHGGAFTSMLKAFSDRGYIKRVGMCFFKNQERIVVEPEVNPESIIRPIPKSRLMAGRA